MCQPARFRGDASLLASARRVAIHACAMLPWAVFRAIRLKEILSHVNNVVLFAGVFSLFLPVRNGATAQLSGVGIAAIFASA